MRSIMLIHQCNWSSGFGNEEHIINTTRGKFFNKVPTFSGYYSFPSVVPSTSREFNLSHGHCLLSHCCTTQSGRQFRPVFSGLVDDAMDPDESEGGPNEKEESDTGEIGGVNSDMLRENLERIVGTDDSAFSGIDLATLIRNKYGRSYDVQLIKKTVGYSSFLPYENLMGTCMMNQDFIIIIAQELRDLFNLAYGELDILETQIWHFMCMYYFVPATMQEFMGRNLLALNVMWKYMEQRSFPLTEEEYLLHLDDVANTLKCWGAVSHIRNSLAKLKDRPRIGKAVSIFIDMDESGGRANEWIYK